MTLDTLDVYIQKHMESFHTPGASVAVTDQSETLWEREYGFRDLESRQPVCSETRFQLGSITKTFTAFALMQLYDRGVGAIVCINGPGSPFFPYYTVTYALALFHAEMEGLRAPKEPALPERQHIGNASDYAGQYHRSDQHLRVSQEEGHLFLRFGEDAWPLEKQGEDTMVSNHPEFSLYPLHFVRDQSGKVIELEHGGDVCYVGTFPEDGNVSYPDEWQSFVGHYRMYSPWTPANFRVVLRRGKLFLVDPGNISYRGYEDELHPIKFGIFRLGSDDSPDTLEFADIVEDKTLRASRSGAWHYRVSME